jgi:hypothetical protein
MYIMDQVKTTQNVFVFNKRTINEVHDELMDNEPKIVFVKRLGAE